MRTPVGIFAGMAWAIIGMAGAVSAQDRVATEPPSTENRAAPAVLAEREAASGYGTALRAVLGRGYVPYSYPGFNSCPCAWDGCFHPHRYYCGADEYRRTWRQRWVRAHLGLGSMLDGYPCECIYPTVGRTYSLDAGTNNQAGSRLSPQPELPPKPRY